MLNLSSSAYTIRNGGEGQYEFFADISTRSLQSVRVGEGAGKISVGSGNAFVGFDAGHANANGSFGAFVGFQAGAQNLNGNYCTFVGAYAGRENQRGDANTFVGYRAGELNKDGSECVAVGAYAMRENYSGNRTVAIGYRAAERTLDADFNTIIGAEAGQDNRSGNFNTMAGFRSGRAAFKGNENTYFGSYAGYSNSLGDGNAFVGFKAGEYLTQGYFNVAVGAYALQKASTGNSNIAIGAFSGTTATGDGNLFVGTNAGTSNVTGDNSVYLGTDAGYNANGSENVYIGKSAAYNIFGNQNVVTGAYTMMDLVTSGSVIVGYGIGDIFTNGNSNVLIGYKVDTHDPANSYGIAIGTRNVKTYHHSIAIGQNIDCSGLASVSIGRGIISDSENSISIGNDLDVSSVYVLSDPLDYRAPVNQSKTYELFNMQENYTDTIYDGIQSNTSAVFAVNTINIYNSGTNRDKGAIPQFDSNLTNLFNFHISYQGAVLPITSPSSAPQPITSLFNYINESSNIRKKNLEAIYLNTGTTEISSNTQLSTNGYDLVVNFPTSIYNGQTPRQVGIVGVNLIKYVSPSNEFTYKFYFPKRAPIYQLNNTSNAVLQNTYDYIRASCNLSAASSNFNVAEWQYETTADGYDNGTYGNVLSNVILTPPRYGRINHRLFANSNIDITYAFYPEGLFASNDTFTVASTRDIDGTNVLSDQPRTIQIISSNQEYFNSNVLYIHPYQPTYLDRSHLLRKPLYSPAAAVQLVIGSNLKVVRSNVSYSNQSIAITYQDLVNQSIQLMPVNSNVTVNEQLRVTINGAGGTPATYYPLKVFYHNTSNYVNDYASSNIVVSLPTSNVLANVALPPAPYEQLYIREYPMYGLLIQPSYTGNTSNYNLHDMRYQSYHPTADDKAEILIRYRMGSNQYYKILSYQFVHDNNYYSLPLYHLHASPSNDILNTVTIQSISTQSSVLKTSYDDQQSVTVTNGTLPSKQSYIRTYTCNLETYNSNIGYVSHAVLRYNDNYNHVNYDGGLINDETKLLLPLPTPYDGFASNIFYYQYTGVNPITTPNNNGSYNLRTVNSNNTILQTYFFYGNSVPYYEYELVAGGGPANVYWQYIKQVTTTEYYTMACNLSIQSYVENLITQRYYDIQGQTGAAALYQSNLPSIALPAASNYTLFTSNTPVGYTSTSNISIVQEYRAFIPVHQVQPTDLYQRNGVYNYLPTDSNLKIIQRNQGIVMRFAQSNVQQRDIFLWLNSNVESAYDRYTLHFDNQRTLDFYYYSNIDPIHYSSCNQSFNFSLSNFVSEPIYGDNSSSNFIIDTLAPASTIAIQALSNSVLIRRDNYEMVSQIDYAAPGASGYAYVPLLRNARDEEISYFYIDTPNNHARTLLTKPVLYDFYLQQQIYVNTSLCDRLNYITSNHLYTSHSVLPANKLEYKILGQSNAINLTRFTQEDINQNLVYLYDGSNTVDYVVCDFDAPNDLITAGKYSVSNYKNTIYPATASASASASSNEIVQIQDNYAHNRIGLFWNQLEQYTSNANPSELFIHINKQPQKGYFYSSNTALTVRTNVVSKFTWPQFKSDTLYYIPYTPMELSNDSYQFYLEYKGDVSDVYTMTLKNYWARFSPLLIDDGRPIPNPQYTIDPTLLPRSEGLQQDNYTWSCNSSAYTLSIKGYTLPIQAEAKKFTGRPYFNTATRQKNIDIGGYFNFKDLLDYTVSSNARDLHFYVSSNPVYGSILHKAPPSAPLTAPPYYADAYFTYADIMNNQVFYHHFGENSNQDTFHLNVGSAQISDTSIYDVSLLEQALEYQVQFFPKAELTKNETGYIYKGTCNEILTSSNLLNNAALEITRGNIIVYQTCNIDLYKNQQPISHFSKAELDGNQVYYKVNSNVFQQGGGSNTNQEMFMTFSVSSLSNVTDDVDPITTLPYYEGLYLQKWTTHLNQYVSSNVVQKNLASNQIVQYYKRTFDNDAYNFDNRRLQIDFTLNPEQQVLYATADTYANTFDHVKYLSRLENFTFDFKIQDRQRSNLVLATFTKSQVTLTSPGQSAVSINLTSPFLINQTNTVSIVLNDDRNKNNLSLYVNNRNYLDGVGYRPNIPSASNIHAFMLQTNIEDPLNYYNYILTSNISPHVNLYYDLDHYANKLKFNDFNIFVNTYTIDERAQNSNESYVFSSNVHNVILGKLLDVKGYNNICIGQNFKTVGTDSIIIGNSIGVNKDSQGGTSLNEIFQSIVIANNSFINSKVRDVIAIGTNILSNVTFDLTDFLLKRPVLIGNDIDAGLIDFHINIDNTFLKTTAAPVPAIYLGLQQEVVAIGYPSNQGFSNEYQLYVNGGISYNGSITSIGVITSKKQVFGNIVYSSGTVHHCRVAVAWTVAQSDDSTAFTISGKFRGILTDSAHIYRRFESWVTGKNDSITSKPKGLTDFEIASYASTGITDYEHSITRYTATAVVLDIVWTTAFELSLTDKMTTHLDLEVSYPSALGTMSMALL